MTILMKASVAMAILAAVITLAAPASNPLDTPEVFSKSVYKLLEPQSNSGGTGFLVRIKDRSFVLTNRHVCDVAKFGILMAEVESRQIPVRVLADTMAHDLCLTTAPVGARISDALLISSQDVARFDLVTIVGYPRLGPLQPSTGYFLGTGVEEIAYDQAEITEDGPKCQKPEYQVKETLFGPYCVMFLFSGISNADSAPGSSGSPVLNQRGRVIGVLFAGGSGLTYFVPLSFIQDFIAAYLRIESGQK